MCIKISNENANFNDWHKCIEIIKFIKTKENISGILLVFDVAELIFENKNILQQKIDLLENRLYELQIATKTQIAIYIIINKCDLINGFTEYFSHLRKDNLEQVFGMTFSLENTRADATIIQQYLQASDKLSQILKSHMVFVLNAEANKANRELIFSFPQQMQLLTKNTENLLSMIMLGIKNLKMAHIRGVYFTSSSPENAIRYDLVLMENFKNFKNYQSTMEWQSKTENAYFTAQLFNRKIYPEGKYFSARIISLTQKEFFKRLKFTSGIAFLGLWTLLLQQAYLKGITYIKKISDELDVYYNIEADNTNISSLSYIEPALKIFTQAKLEYQNYGILKYLLISNYYLKSAVDSAQERFLKNEFLPRVAIILQEQLHLQNLDQENLYILFRAYLALFQQKTQWANTIMAAMQNIWQKEQVVKPVRKNLQENLNIALSYGMPKFPEDASLIEQIRQQLAKLSPYERAYMLLELQAHYSQISDLSLTQSIGRDFNVIFDVKNKILNIPNLYTYSGYEYIFLKYYQKIAKEVAGDNVIINESNIDAAISAEQIASVLKQRYKEKYIQVWQGRLNELKLKHANSFSDLQKMMTAISAKSGPFNSLLKTIYENTEYIDFSQINNHDLFSKLNLFYDSDDGINSWKSIASDIAGITEHIKNLTQKIDIDNAALNDACAMFSTNKDTILQLFTILNHAPEPLNTWMQHLSNNYFQLEIFHAKRQLNKIWERDIVSYYNSNLANKYPFNYRAASAVDVVTINHFLGKSGILHQFVKNFMEPIIENKSVLHYQNIFPDLKFKFPLESIRFYNQEKLIEKYYFHHNQNKISVQINIRPETLSARAAEISWGVGDQVIFYSHGPQKWTRVLWPEMQNISNNKITIKNFNNDYISLSEYGEWGLFKIISQGSILNCQHDNICQIKFDIKGYQSVFSIQANDINAIINLPQLFKFKFPKKII